MGLLQKAIQILERDGIDPGNGTGDWGGSSRGLLERALELRRVSLEDAELPGEKPEDAGNEPASGEFLSGETTAFEEPVEEQELQTSEQPVEEIPVEEIPVEEIPVEEMPLEDGRDFFGQGLLARAEQMRESGVQPASDATAQPPAGGLLKRAEALRGSEPENGEAQAQGTHEPGGFEDEQVHRESLESILQGPSAKLTGEEENRAEDGEEDIERFFLRDAEDQEPAPGAVPDEDALKESAELEDLAADIAKAGISGGVDFSEIEGLEPETAEVETGEPEVAEMETSEPEPGEQATVQPEPEPGEQAAVQPEPEPGEQATVQPEPEPGVTDPESQFLFDVRASLAEGRTIELINRLAALQQDEDPERFLELLAGAFAATAGGNSALIYVPHRGSFRLESRWDRDPGKAPAVSRKRFGRNSELMRFMHHARYVLTSEKQDQVDRTIQEELAAFQNLDPWALIPIPVGEELTGLVVVGERTMPGSENEATGEELKSMLLARVCALYLYSLVLEKNLQESVDKLMEEKREILSMLDLYNYGEVGRLDLDGVLAAAAEGFDITTAVLTGNWEGRGSVKVLASTGLSEKGVKKYRVAKNDREIAGVIRSGEPAVLDDIEQRLSKLPEEDQASVSTFVVAPVLFDDQTLAVLMIHQMKGVRSSLGSAASAVVKNIAQSLVPFLLHRRMIEMQPFQVFEELLEREAALARKKRLPLHVVSFRIKNYKNLIQEQGFRKYRQRLDRFYDKVCKTAGDATVQITALNKVVLLLREKDEQAEEIIRVVKSEVNQMVKKEKTRLPLSFTPMRTVYPNDSRSVSDIIQVLE